MKTNRTRLGLVGALSAMLMASAVGAPARAAVPDSAPGTTATAPETAVAAVSPSVSPAVPSFHVKDGALFSCAAGSFCAAVRDPTTGDWKVHVFRQCGSHYLSNWEGNGFYRNNHTVPVKLIGSNGNVLREVPPGGGIVSVDWSAVWAIRLC
ncbi:hypothetical protein ACF07T_19070 [Streptomyces sp. NPDC015184]|uniref:hypothetical protein n=1 Tax=Streptomyces sp. NPDC015184 TaxID=3364946 RepID=UPI0036FA4427